MKPWIIIATNRKVYYQFAFNLAVSLKAAMPEYEKQSTKHPIILLTDGNEGKYLSSSQLAIFDSRITFHAEHLSIISQQPFFAKTLLSEYVEEGVYVDSDSLCIGSPDGIFTKTENHPFAAHLNEYHRYDTAITDRSKRRRPVEWCDVADTYEHYQIPRERFFSSINASIIAYTKDGHSIFKDAQKIFYDKDCPVRLYGKAGNFPDEIAFEVAMLQNDYVNPELKGVFWWVTKTEPTTFVSWSKDGKERPFLSLFGPDSTTRLRAWELNQSLPIRFAKALEKQNGLVPGSLGNGFKIANAKEKAGANHEAKWFSKKYQGVK